MLRLLVESASNLPSPKFGTPDPIASVTFKGEKKKTKSIDNELNPVWNEKIEFDLKGESLNASSSIVVVVKDYETIGKDKFIGSATISLRDLASGQKTLPFKNIALLSEKKQPTGGSINLVATYEPPAGAGPPNPSDLASSSAQDAGGDEDEDAEDGAGDVGDAGTSAIPSTPGQAAAHVSKRLRKKKSKRLLSNKPQDFQIRVRIISARQLPGNNVKPVVKVTVCNQTHRTRIRRGNNPHFDEIFFYNVTRSPEELFDEPIQIRVYNSFSLRSDSLMGEFKLDIGYVYDEPGHAILRKWLLLHDPEDTSTGSKGYMKVSLFVLATGDDPPVEKKEANEEHDDVESNLLLPAGLTLRWVTFLLKVYRAEDIPQMDDAFAETVKSIFGAGADKKNLVDPYVEVGFAGKKLCTKIIEKNANPEWNQTINLQVKFPSMCERISLTVFDWDRLTRNDAIGTAFLYLSKIASSGGEVEGETGDEEVGFLPAFGPCYVNFYGSPREYTGFADPHEDLNCGKGEGVAYRGRILIELITKLDANPEKKLEDIPSDDVLVVQKYQRRRKYSLSAVFYAGTMQREVGDAIQFEVSMGNYGNKFDKTCRPLASTTQYSRAVFDGNYYYYLPWANTKPVVTLTSYWEDISHRLDVVNIILKIVHRMEKNLMVLRTAVQAKVSEERLAELWLKIIEQVIEDCSRPLPKLEGKSNVTQLDLQILKLRKNTLEGILESAKRTRMEAEDPKDTIDDIEDWLERLKSLAEEPQNSMPDVIIWMIRDEKRVAYARIPAYEVLYSTTGEEACGKYCGKTRTIFLKYVGGKNKNSKIPIQLRVRFWLGLFAVESKFNSFSEGNFSVFSELYENQAQLLGKWGTSGLVGRHKFSDVTGKIKLKKENFMPPRGWEWEGDWFVDPEKSLLTEADAGHTEFIDEVYENNTRYPGAEWKVAEEPYTDLNGEKSSSKEEVECPPGWNWLEDWEYDVNRAVDEQGWEYGLTIPPDDRPKSWVSTEKMYHTHRRRRWVRRRKKDNLQTAQSQKSQSVQDLEGWEYASLIGWNFHMKQRKSDTYRRRRWRRKMAPSGRLGAAAVFKLEGALAPASSEDGDKSPTDSVFGASAPTISCVFDRPSIYHLRCYIYQARAIVAMDKDSFSDPYAHVSFLHQSKTTEVIKSTLNPTWDQTLIFNDIDIYGSPETLIKNPPNVMIEIFDEDQVGKDEFLGRCACSPMVKLNPETDVTPKLLWYPIKNGTKKAGELLIAAELILKDKPDGSNLPILPPVRSGVLYMVPHGIRPVVQLTAIEILTWGLRNMKNYQLAAVASPSLIVECGGEYLESAVIKSLKRCPNFPSSVLFMKVLLPKEEMYTPPIVIKVIDHRPFGRKPVVGQCTIHSLQGYRIDPYAERETVGMQSKASLLSNARDCVIDIEDNQKPLLESQFVDSMTKAVIKMTTPSALHMVPTDSAGLAAFRSSQAAKEEESIDWWSKFYASIGEHERCGTYLQKGYDTLKVYTTELENVPEFKGLTDFCHTFKLFRGKSEDDEDPSVVGEFKGSFKIYPLSDDPNIQTPPRQFAELPDSGTQECLVRIYIIRGIDLQPKDSNGKCDPYVKISLGKKSIEDRDHYIPNTLNPVFGRMFELSCNLPTEKDLKISLYDFDLLTRDEKVGETIIDLENRLLSRFGACSGLPQSYCLSGVNAWRDQLKPSQLLQTLAKMKGLSPPVISSSRLSYNGQEYVLSEIENNKTSNIHLGPAEERLALHVLRQQGLVPEHTEMRTLYSTYQPNLSQGKLQMWVDIYPKSLGPPGPPFDITPRKPKNYFLRCIIWNTSDVLLDETSITGEEMSDIYVKGWMAGLEDEKQKTDVHYRSLGGEGNFNWRLIFPFDYLPAEQLCVVSKKENFWSLDKTEVRTPPKLMIQIWDNDKFSMDDYLGVLELDLNSTICPAKTAAGCNLKMLPDPSTPKAPKVTSIFAQKSINGWWPCVQEKDGKRILAGKVEMTLEILTEQEAEQKPAGKARDEPNMNPKLEPPNRPETSFLWFTSPCKTMKYIIWRRFKWIFLGIIILLFVVLFLGIFFYSLPNYLSMRIVNPI
ncbi:myoferlin isoform X2 [Carcharodon carcharias]|uniref:myoferlin isoform X2 n=1 Tax=Carcharodon carcharias TaxID=13397 RepID=UPI001B7F49AF|nr:myoferlin isoform X2 [Carcharodon carcharias]